MKNGLIVLHSGPRAVVSHRAQAGPLFWKHQAVPTQQHPFSSLLLTSQPKRRQKAGATDLPPPEAVHTWQKSWHLLWDRHELRKTQLRANACRTMPPLLAEEDLRVDPCTTQGLPG